MKDRRVLVVAPVAATLALAVLLLVSASTGASGVASRGLSLPQSDAELPIKGNAATRANSGWSSGWLDINPGDVMTLTHNVGGNPDDYAVELWYRDTAPGGYGINHRGYGGLEAGGRYYGANWQNLTDTTVQVLRRKDDTVADQVRVRIWQPDPPDYDSGWVDIAPGTLETLTHNLGGNVDDYTVGLWFKDTTPGGMGVNTRCYGGMEAAGQRRGAAWQNLTDTTIDVWRYPNDGWADQIRIRIFVPDPPDYDSGWVDINQGRTITLTHNLGGNPNRYVVRGWQKDTTDGIGINHRFAGGFEAGGSFFGTNWENLTDTMINLFRRADDEVADQVRVRIWVREFNIYLPLVMKEHP